MCRIFSFYLFCWIWVRRANQVCEFIKEASSVISFCFLVSVDPTDAIPAARSGSRNNADNLQEFFFKDSQMNSWTHRRVARTLTVFPEPKLLLHFSML